MSWRSKEVWYENVDKDCLHEWHSVRSNVGSACCARKTKLYSARDVKFAEDKAWKFRQLAQGWQHLADIMIEAANNEKEKQFPRPQREREQKKQEAAREKKKPKIPENYVYGGVARVRFPAPERIMSLRLQKAPKQKIDLQHAPIPAKHQPAAKKRALLLTPTQNDTGKAQRMKQQEAQRIDKAVLELREVQVTQLANKLGVRRKTAERLRSAAARC